MPTLAPDLVYYRGEFKPDLAIEFESTSGRITRVTPAAELTIKPLRLRGRAILPGFINAHSHAFQRLIRGRTEWKAAGERADFWSWRDAMYAAALRLSPDEVYNVSRFCFIEMLKAGYTCVGEFHYLHRDPDGAPYEVHNELALRIIAAARDVGIRMTLLNCAYVTGGIGKPLLFEQRRFGNTDPEEFVRDMDELAQHACDVLRIGVAPHSVRAVPREWLRILGKYARSHVLPLHMHVSEQVAEVESCVDAYGLRPVELLQSEGLLDERFTGVHCTHIDAHEIQLLAVSGATVCACPSTERDLGDGLLQASELFAAGVPIAVGTDSQTFIAPLEEARHIEFHERLRKQRRVILADGAPTRNAPVLMRILGANGARSLGWNAGVIESGSCADFVAIDLAHASLAGWDESSLDSLLTMTAPPDVVTDVWVAGKQRVTDRKHELSEQALQGFLSAL